MKISRSSGACQIEISTDRIDARVALAQHKLDAQILTDSTQYVPFQQGMLRSSGHIPEDGVIEWDVPYAHYQYEGVQYIDPKLGVSGVYTEGYGWWSHAGVTKEPTNKPLKYSEPGTGSHWFDTAKTEHMKDWERLVRDTIGGKDT